MKNKKFINKKSLVIIVLILITLVIAMLLLFNKSITKKTEVVNCSLILARNSVIQKVQYVDDVFTYVEFEQRLNLDFDAITTTDLDKAKDSLIFNLEKQFETLSESADYFVRIEDKILVYGYNLSANDYRVLEKQLKESDDDSLSSTDNFYDDKNRFIQQVTNQGGECTYE